MKGIIRFLIFLVASGFALAHAADNSTLQKFSDYAVNVYHGQLKVPNYYSKANGEWRDDMGKLVAPPEINFAGKYYIGTHSCGTECRYYTLSNLTSGADSNALDMFSNDEGHPQKTYDGRSYITTLVSRPDSRMLVAQYHIEQSATSMEECRERIFIFSEDGKMIKPVTSTIKFCEEFK